MKVSYPGNPGTLKTNADLLFGDCFFPHFAQLLYYAGSQQVFLGSSTQKRPGATAASATQQSHKDLGVFFMAPTRFWCLGQKNTGMHQV